MSNIKSLKQFTCVDFHGNTYKVAEDDLIWRPSVYVVVIRDGKILLTRQMGSYNLPGGGMEFGEMPESTAVRETEEETGIKVANPRLLACKSNLFKALRSDDVDDFLQSILLFYACDYTGGEFSIDGLDEHEQTWTELPEWMPLDNLDTIKRGSSFEWRDVVKKAITEKASV
ncbi:MAG TPA: NUDIX domain-containing protein [Candidatus Saccharimonadales bacterium]